MKVPCYNCNTVTELEVNFDVVNFVCPKCSSIYIADKNGELRLRSKFKPTPPDFALKVGDKGILQGEECTVTGMVVKKIQPSYYWKEYILETANKKYIYLSESKGHWMILKEIEDQYKVSDYPRTIDYEGDYFDLYEYADSTVHTASGFFDYSLEKARFHTVEYIAPPRIISIEKSNNVQTTFLGEYLPQKEFKKAFPTEALPYKWGVSIIQSFYFNLKHTGIILCFFALLIFFTDWYIYKDQVKQTVFQKAITFDQFNNREITSEPFVLKGGSAPMTIYFSTDVSNSWANVDVTLVDESNSNEIHASKDIEFYEGFEDGERWTEGNTSEKFNICGVKQGKYHLLITPMKAPEDVVNNQMKIKVVWNEPSSRNIWLVIIFMIVVYIAIRLLNYNFEKKRWADSSYSRYGS